MDRDAVLEGVTDLGLFVTRLTGILTTTGLE